MGQELSKKFHYNTQRCNYKTNSSESIKRQDVRPRAFFRLSLRSRSQLPTVAGESELRALLNRASQYTVDRGHRRPRY